MRGLNIRKYAGMMSLATSGVLVLSGCGYSIVGQSVSTMDNKNGGSQLSEYYIDASVSSETDFNNCEDIIYDSRSKYVDDIIYDSSSKYVDNVENVTESVVTTESVSEAVITTEFVSDSVVTTVCDTTEDIIYMASEESSEPDPFAYAGEHEYMNNISLSDDSNCIRGKIIHASGFSGASNNFITLDDSSCSPGYNVVTYYINDGNGNCKSQVLCVCAKRIDLIDGIPVIYFRNDEDVLDIINSKNLSTDKIRISDLYSKNLLDYPVCVDESGDEFITYNGMEFDKVYVKTR